MTAAIALPDTLRVIERGWLSSNNTVCFDGDAATVIDSGYVGHAEQTVEKVREVLAGRRLARVINTHSHSDHIGGNAALQRAFGCRIAIPAGIEAHIRDWDETALLLTTAAQRGDRFVHDEVVHAGQTLTLGGFPWHAYAAPGHDRDALVFYSPAARVLVSGDALWEDGFGVVFGELFGQPDGSSGLAVTRATLEMIGRLAIDTVIPGHGRPFGEVDAALERAFKRLDAYDADPSRVAKNALKACFIFNLLDLQGLPRDQLESHLEATPIYRLAGREVLGLDTPALAGWLLDELTRARALVVADGRLLATMAA